MIFELCGWRNQTVEVGSIAGLKKLVGVKDNAIILKVGEPRVLAMYDDNARAEQVFNKAIETFNNGEELFTLPKN